MDSNVDRDNAWKLGRIDEFDTLSGADEREREEVRRETIYGFLEQDKRFATYSYPVPPAAESLWNRRGRNDSIQREEDVRRQIGGKPLLTDLSLAMRTDALALIRGATEFLTIIYVDRTCSHVCVPWC